MNTQIPTLYKTTATGAIQTWRVDVNGDSYTVTHGQLDGKLQTKTTVCTGKNIGKKNETSPTEQALLEAVALHTKQIERKGYTLEIGGKSNLVESMGCLDFRNVPHRVKDDAALIFTPKLDGLRAIWIPEIGKFQTRKGLFYNVPHLEQALKDCSLLLDGEIYLHGTELNRIGGAAKAPNDITPLLEFHVFDVVDFDLTAIERLKLISEHCNGIIKQVPTYHGKKSDIKQYHDEFTALGFEGVCFKLADANYTKGKTPSQFKYKEFLDSEFQIIGVTTDKDGHGIIQCDGFTVVLGNHAERLHQLQNPHEYVGKQITVKYQKMTEFNKPQFPVGVAIRDDAEVLK